MVLDGVVPKYAIGGAIGAFYYIESTHTEDIDIFTVFPVSGTLVDVQPIYDYLKEKGHQPEEAFVKIGGWLVLFLPPAASLEEEALDKAISVSFKETPTSIFSAEHLAAIMLRVGRNKDYIRLESMLAYDKFDKSAFMEIVKRHNLQEKWADYAARFLKEEEQ